MTRRHFLDRSAVALASVATLGSFAAPVGGAAAGTPGRRFTLSFAPGLIGIAADPSQLLTWAAEFGFESAEPPVSFLAKASDADLAAYLTELKSKKLSWGAAGFPLDFRGSDSSFEAGMKLLPAFARTLQRAGVTRTATWISPAHATLTYTANFRLHTNRLRAAAGVLNDHGLRLGLEYVGPKTSWSSKRYPFIHTMAEMKDLIAEIGLNNVGLLLDSWHWYTAGESAADILSLSPSDVVLCHLNDAPKDIPVDQQLDSRRGLPCATGVIDLKSFLGALVQIGYDGPVACEPFSQELRKLPPRDALASVSAAMKKAAALVET